MGRAAVGRGKLQNDLFGGGDPASMQWSMK
jgi:hypothetical protein